MNPQKGISHHSLGTWATAQGLPQNSIGALVQTRDDYMWLGTQEGLARFDGVRFRIFDGGNTAAFTNNHMSAMLEAGDGTLWVGTFGGGLIRSRNGSFESVRSAQTGGGDAVMTLAEDGKGALWVGTSASGAMRLENGRSRPARSAPTPRATDWVATR